MEESKSFLLIGKGKDRENYLNKLTKCISRLHDTDFGMREEIPAIIQILSLFNYDENKGIYPGLKVLASSGFPVVSHYLGLVRDKDNIESEIDYIRKGIKEQDELNPEAGIGEEAARIYKKEAAKIYEKTVIGGGALTALEQKVLSAKCEIVALLKNKIYSFNPNNPATARRLERIERPEDYYASETNNFRRIKHLEELPRIELFGRTNEDCKITTKFDKSYDDLVHSVLNMNYHSCDISLMGFDATKNLFAKYVINLLDAKHMMLNTLISKDRKLLEGFSRTLNDCFSHEPEAVFELVGRKRGIIPRSVRRYILGPFYNAETQNPPPLDEIITADSYALKASCDGVESADKSIHPRFSMDDLLLGDLLSLKEGSAFEVIKRPFRRNKIETKDIPKKDYLVCSDNIATKARSILGKNCEILAVSKRLKEEEENTGGEDEN